MDLAALTNAPAPMLFGGETFLVSALTLKEWGIVQAWIKANVPSPLAVLQSSELAHLSKEDKAAMFSEALKAARAWPPRIATQDWFNALDHPGGQVVFLMTVLGKHNEGMTAERAEAIAANASQDQVADLALAALGIEADHPKAPEANGAGP